MLFLCCTIAKHKQTILLTFYRTKYNKNSFLLFQVLRLLEKANNVNVELYYCITNISEDKERVEEVIEMLMGTQKK